MSIEGREPLLESSGFVSTLAEATETGFQVLTLRLIGYAVGFVASVLITRAVGPSGRGLYTLPVAILGIVIALSHIGLENAHVWLASQGASLRQLWANATVASLVIGLLAWLVVALLYVTSGSQLFGGLPAMWVAVPIALVPFLLQTLYWTSLLQLRHRIVGAMAASLAGVIVHAIACAVLFATGQLTPFRVLLLMWVVNGAAWLLILLLCWKDGLIGDAPHGPTLRRALGFGLKTWIGLVFFFLVLRVDQVLVQRILGFRELGLYSLAVTLAELLWLLTDPFAVALLPHQVEAARGDEMQMTYATVRTSVVIAVVAATLGWVLIPYAVRGVYGSAFAGSVWPFRLLLPGVVLLAAQRPLVAIFLKRGRPWLITMFGLAALAVNIVANLLLLPRIGIAGASIASSICYAALALAYVFATWQRGKSRWFELVPSAADVRRLWIVVRRAR
jgi:O-antigen/teichoic acid export membrane protein